MHFNQINSAQPGANRRDSPGKRAESSGTNGRDFQAQSYEHALTKVLPPENIVSECARIHFEAKRIAETKSELFDSIVESGLKGDAAYRKMAESGVEHTTVAAVLLVAKRFSPAQLREVLDSTDIPVSRRVCAAHIALKGLEEICASLKIKRRPSIREVIDFTEQEHCNEVLHRLAKWAKNPQNGKAPGDVIKLSIPALVKMLPWLDGRDDQLGGRYRELVVAGHFQGSRFFNRVYSWIEVKNNGVITLTVSASNRHESAIKDRNYNPILGCYMIGAATHQNGLSVDIAKNGFTNVKFLLSRAEAAERVKKLYPKIGDRRIIQESLIMLGGGAINLLEFEEPRLLRVVSQEVKAASGTKLSKTACLTVATSLHIEKPKDKKDENSGTVTRNCKIVVGLPSALTLDKGIVRCRIMVGREAAHHVAINGVFKGCRFELIGLTEDSDRRNNVVGKLLFKEQQPKVMPRFALETERTTKNCVQASKWGALTQDWLSLSKASKPIGSTSLKISRHPSNKNHAYITLGGSKVTLLSFPANIEDLIAIPVDLGNKVIAQRYVFLFTEGGKLSGVLGFPEAPGERKLKAYVPYSVEDPIGRVASDWHIFRKRAEIIWLERLDR